MLTRRFSLSAALFALALLITACGDNPMGPRPAPHAATASRNSEAVTSGLSGTPAELLTQLAAGKCADVAGRSQTPNTPLIVWTCHGNGNQQFVLPPAGTTGPIHVYDDATCLDARGGLGRDNDAVIVFPCYGTPNQQWTVTAQGEIQGISGKCLDVRGASQAEGAALIIYQCNGGANQHWTSGTAPVLARDLAVVRGDQAGVPAAPALVATFNVSSATSATATITAPDGSVRTTAPVDVVSGHARVVVVGLHPNTPYTIAAVGLTNGTPASTSAPTTATTGGLPAALSSVRMNVTAGKLPSGYLLAPITGGNGLSYIVAFDTTGTIVWSREFGGDFALDVQQHANGHFTFYSGGALQGAGTFHEIDAQGNLIHDWTAPTGYDTDGHEIVLVSDANGNTTSALLFGRHNVSMDLSGHGGPVNGTTQTNTVFRLSTSGQATALFTGTDRFTAADWISPSTSVNQFHDFDHPNAIALTADGGFVVSWRNMRAITKHDASGHFQWQLGGLQTTLAYTGDPYGGFDGQHHVRVLPNGNFTFFDNGQLHSPPESRGVEVNVDLSTNTATAVRIDRNHNEVLHSPYQGSNQRLSNGNAVLDYAQINRVVEYDPSSNVVWSAHIERTGGPDIAFVYRAFRIRSIEQYLAP